LGKKTSQNSLERKRNLGGGIHRVPGHILGGPTRKNGNLDLSRGGVVLGGGGEWSTNPLERRKKSFQGPSGPWEGESTERGQKGGGMRTHKKKA